MQICVQVDAADKNYVVSLFDGKMQYIHGSNFAWQNVCRTGVKESLGLYRTLHLACQTYDPVQIDMQVVAAVKGHLVSVYDGKTQYTLGQKLHARRGGAAWPPVDACYFAYLTMQQVTRHITHGLLKYAS